MFDHLQKFRALTEEMLTGVGSATADVVLIFTIDYFVHARLKYAVFIGVKQWIPVATPNDFNYVPACPTKYTFQLLNDLAVTTHRAIQSLQVAVNNEN